MAQMLVLIGVVVVVVDDDECGFDCDDGACLSRTCLSRVLARL